MIHRETQRTEEINEKRLGNSRIYSTEFIQHNMCVRVEAMNWGSRNIMVIQQQLWFSAFIFSISAIQNTEIGSLYKRGELYFCLWKIIWVNLAFKRCQWVVFFFFFLNTRMRFHANLNCDKLWISYAGSNPISPPRTAWEMRKYFGQAHTVYLSQEKNHLLWPWREKVTSPFCEASPRLRCAVPVW